MGNERADKLAKDAALKIKTSGKNDRCPISCVKKSLDIKQWSSTTETFMKNLQKSQRHFGQMLRRLT